MPMIGIPQKIGLMRGRKITSPKIIGKPNLVRNQPYAISLFILGMFFFGIYFASFLYVIEKPNPVRKSIMSANPKRKLELTSNFDHKSIVIV